MDPSKTSYLEAELDDEEDSEPIDSHPTVVLLSVFLGLLTLCLVVVTVYFFRRWKNEKSGHLNADPPFETV